MMPLWPTNDVLTGRQGVFAYVKIKRVSTLCMRESYGSDWLVRWQWLLPFRQTADASMNNMSF